MQIINTKLSLRLAIASLCTALLLSTVANAQGADIAFGGLQHDSSLPVEIASDTLSVSQEDGRASFDGDVLIAQGSLKLAAQSVEVVYSADGQSIGSLVATGGVTITNGGEAAEAQRAEYDLETSQIVLSGSVLVTQQSNALSGERMVIDLTTGNGRMEGRVRTIFQAGSSQ